MRRIIRSAILCLALMQGVVQHATAQTINLSVEKTGSMSNAAQLTGPAGGLGETWNQVTGFSASALLNSTGAATTVGFTTDLDGIDQWGSPSLQMLWSGLRKFGTGATFHYTITGLTPGDYYDVYIGSANANTGQRSKGDWTTPNETQTVGIQTVDNTVTHNLSTWQQGNNYVLFQYVKVNPSGRIVLNGDGADGYRLPVNGFQLVKSPLGIITSFGIPGSTGVINQNAKTISLSVPFGTNLATLAPAFTLASGTCNQTSGSPPSPTFASSNPVTYTVTDGSTVNNYTVTVTVAPASSACAMLTCSFGALGNATINEAAGTVLFTVPPAQPVTALAPTFTLSPNATINPASGSTQDFTNPVVYRVTAQNGVTFKDYTVTVQTFALWTYSGSLFIDTTANGANVSGSVTDFPLLLRFNSNNFNFAQAQSDGRDIRFVTASGTALSYQIEQWDAANQRATVWVRIPAIAGNSTQEIIMYWGKSGVSSLSSGAAVFNSSSGYSSVHHLGDTLTDEVGTTTPTNVNTTATNGLIGRGRTFVAGQGIQCGESITGLPTGAGPFSTGVWIRTSTFGKAVLGWGIEQTTGNKVVMFIQNPPRIAMDCNFATGSMNGTLAIPVSEWSHVVQTYEDNTARLYVNGVLDSTNSGGNLMNIPASIRFDIGGFVPTSGFNYVGDMDEVRISNVVRSADWVKLEYENQKPLQTLVGSIVQSGSAFSVSPTTVTMNEATSTTLTAQAGGARKVYWIYKKGAQETLLATDQLTLNYTAPRVTGNDSSIIQFKAVFAGGPQTIDVPLTVLDTVPDPVFTLVPSTTSWDGRTTMTVTANISNLAAMQSAGFGTLNYKWTVNGVAVIKQQSGGTLTLTRSQGSGPMTVSLAIDNGGTAVSNNTIINVQEPATDPWVERTPIANEKPVNGQFFARNPNTNLGTIFYRGTQSGTPDTVFLKVYKTPNGGSETLETTHRQSLVGGAYAFTAPITAGLITYRVVYGTTTGGIDSAPLDTVTDLVCGDAFIIEGQSNALATDNTAPNDTTTTNKWIRTYGLTSTWAYAISKGNDKELGVWGWILANRLVTNNNMPVCIINGAVGGTRIDQHRPNPAGRGLSGAGNVYQIYANLYNRVTNARLNHGIRGLFWHQGEQNQGSNGIDPDYDYKFYQQYFVDISAAWKQDFPNLRNYYFFQIWPAACGDQSRNDQLREVQRTMSRLFSNMKMMSTLGFSPGSSCHYTPAGYQVFSDRIGPLVEQDVYGVNPTSKLTAPNLQQAYFTTPAKNEIALVFDQNMTWNVNAPTMLFLANAAGATSGSVTSGSATGNTIKLQVSGAAAATTITYVKGLVPWVQADILKGTNNIAALTFADVPIATLTPYQTWATNSAQGLTTGVNDGPLMDPDNDGLENILEFVLRTAPMTPSAAALPVIQQNGAQWVFEYDRNDDSLPPATTQVVQYGDNLTGWTDITIPATSAGAVTITPGTPTDHVRIVIPSSGGKVFARLKASQ